MDKFRAAVIGLGFIGYESPDSHVKAYQDCPDTELVVVCDSHLMKARAIPSYAALYRDAISFEPDIVSVCTPVETHKEIVCAIAPYVKAIYCEKPIAETLEDADEMIAACHKHGVILQVNHQRRFGKPVMRWGHGLINNGTHAIDLMRQLCGENWKDKVELKYTGDENYAFEFDIMSNPAPHRLILKGVEHLVDCLKNHHESISSGEEARETLRLLLEYQREIIYER